MLPQDDPGWASYGETVLRWHTVPPLAIDLARDVEPTQRDALHRLGLGASFGLVTPCNPFGRRSDPEENAGRLRRLLAQLDAAGTRYLRVDGCSPDGVHVEPGVALAGSKEEIIALARRWEQSAIYWWDGARFWVEGALTKAAPWPLGGPG